MEHSPASPLWRFGPVLIGATSFAIADVVTKVALVAGSDVTTLATVRSWVGIGILFVWFRWAGLPGFARGGARAAVEAKSGLTGEARWLSWLLGLLFTGNVYFLFLAIEATEVPVAILTYFVYPLLTGLAAAATRLESITWRGIAAAVVALMGLALMIGAHPSGVALIGVVGALAGALCRVAMLLITRARLSQVDSRLVTWHSLLASTLLFTLLLAITASWQPPATAGGWAAAVVLGFTTTTGMLCVYMSTVRIGPFQTALFMNLEPLLTAILSAMFLGEFLTPLQIVGGAIMLAALVTFQLRR